MIRAACCALVLVAACGDDAAVLVDAGTVTDAGTVADADAATVTDAGTGTDGGAVTDTGTVPDAGIVSLDDVLARLRAAAAASDAAAIVQEVAWTSGWPLLDGERALFVTRWDDAGGAVSLVSDLNAWDTAAHPAETVAGTFHVVLLDLTAATTVPEGAKYKWWASTDVYRAPPEATAYGYDAFGEHGYVRPPLDAAWRERFPDHTSAHLELARTVRALLPAGFTPGAAVRTLLLHDGQNVFHPDAPFGGWRADEALADARFADVLVVAVDSVADRMDAYTHVPDTIGGSLTGGRADGYIAMLRDEVLPFVRSRYGVEATGGSLAIGGSSLGGLVTLYLALEEPSLAGCAIAMSPTLGWGAFAGSGVSEALLPRFVSAGHGPVAIYLDSGGSVSGACMDLDGDGVFEDSDDSDNYCVTVQLRDALEAAGHTHGADLFHWHAPGAPHREDAWAARLPMALDACATSGWVAR